MYGFGVDEIIVLVASIEEYILFSGMSMNIDVHDDFSILVTVFNQLPHIVNFRLTAFFTSLPFSIKITTIS